MYKLGAVIGRVCVGCAQIVAMGILLSIGFNLGDRLIGKAKKLKK